MRIISGKYKGKRLTAPKNLPVRPTTDFAKEALFNILQNRLDFYESTVLDLFSGTGNISFEFASRGAEKITAIDAHSGCIHYIRKISTELDFPITAIKMDAGKFLAQNPTSFSIVFADPPYNYDLEQLRQLHQKIFEGNALEDGGLCILEHAKQNDLSQLPHFFEARKYGNSVFSFFMNE